MAELNNADANIIINEDLSTTNQSEIKNYYTDSTIFITGATGMLGKLLLEKLLRSCFNLRKIYVLIRAKQGKSVDERLDDVFQEKIFDSLKEIHPNFIEKITIIRGDCSRSDMGLNKKDRDLLVNEVNCIFHCAGIVCYNENLRVSTHVNVRATKDLLKLAKEIKQIKSFVHVSSVYAHCSRKDIGEEFYQPHLHSEDLLTFVDALGDTSLDKITPVLIDSWPNTYTFTKSVAEDLIKTEGAGLPIVIVRPSMIIATANEPIRGWIDNLYGPTGLLVAANLGITRSILANPTYLVDVVPADYVVNLLLVSSWHIANMKTLNENNQFIGRGKVIEEEIPIYNIVSSPETPITWNNFMSLSTKYSSKIPSTLLVSHNWNTINSNKRLHFIYVLLLHYIPALFVDALTLITGRTPVLISTYRKVDEFMHTFKFFTLNQWFFRNKNTQELWEKLCSADKQLFEFDMSTLNWDLYYYSYMRGVRVYILKDPLETVLKGSAKYLKFQIIHYIFIAALCVFIYKTIRWLF